MFSPNASVFACQYRSTATSYALVSSGEGNWTRYGRRSTRETVSSHRSNKQEVLDRTNPPAFLKLCNKLNSLQVSRVAQSV
jgi:hypothetical protein